MIPQAVVIVFKMFLNCSKEDFMYLKHILAETRDPRVEGEIKRLEELAEQVSTAIGDIATKIKKLHEEDMQKTFYFIKEDTEQVTLVEQKGDKETRVSYFLVCSDENNPDENTCKYKYLSSSYACPMYPHDWSGAGFIELTEDEAKKFLSEIEY